MKIVKVELRKPVAPMTVSGRWAALGRPAAVITKDKVSMVGKDGRAVAEVLFLSPVDLTGFLNRAKVDALGSQAKFGLVTIKIFLLDVDRMNPMAHQIYRTGNTLNVGFEALGQAYREGNTTFFLNKVRKR